MADTNTDRRSSAPSSVDILILSYNALEELRETLRGLTQAPAFVAVHRGRIIVLDNASADGSAEMVRDEFPQVELICSETNLGFGQGMNRLAIEATAEHILLLNSDVVVEEDFLTPLFDALERHPDVIATGPKLFWTDGRVQYSACDFPTLRLELARAVDVLLHGRLPAASRVVAGAENRVRTEQDPAPWCPQFVWATCWLIRRADFLRTGMFDSAFPIYDEDLDLCRRWARSGHRVMYVPEARLTHVGGASGDSRESISQLAFAGRRTYYRRYDGVVGEWCFVAIIRLSRLCAEARGRIRIRSRLRSLFN